MSDAQRPEPHADFETDVDGNPIPSPELLAEQALPAIYSRSPRLVRIVVTGGAIGAVVGAIVGGAMPGGFASSRIAGAVLMALSGAIIGALIAGLVAAGGEAQTAKHVAGRKAEAIDAWLVAHPDGLPDADNSPAEPEPQVATAVKTTKPAKPAATSKQAKSKDASA